MAFLLGLRPGTFLLITGVPRVFLLIFIQSYFSSQTGGKKRLWDYMVCSEIVYYKTIMSPSKNNTVGVYSFESFAPSPSLSCKAN